MTWGKVEGAVIYDAITGQRLTVIDENGQVTETMYDRLRRRVTDNWKTEENTPMTDTTVTAEEQVEAPSIQQQIIDAVEVREVGHAVTGENNRPHQFIATAATMLLVCRDLGINKVTDVRQTIAKQVTAEYEGANAESDNETEVSVLLGQKAWEKLGDTIERLGLIVTETKYEAPARPERTSSRTSRKAVPQECTCGCGEMTGGGRFRPGHDAKMKSRLLVAIDNQVDQASADKMVEMGWATEEAMHERMNRAKVKAAGNEAAARARLEQLGQTEAAAVDEEK